MTKKDNKNSAFSFLLLAALALVLAACAGESRPSRAEAPPPTRAKASPIGAPDGGTMPLAQLESAPDAPAAPLEPDAAGPSDAGAGSDDAETLFEPTAAPEKIALLSPLETNAPAPVKPSGQTKKAAPKPNQELDLIERTLLQIQEMGIKLDDKQLKKLRTVSTGYDFLAVPPGDERRKMRRKYMTEIYETVLTPEQQQHARQKRGF